MVNFYPYIVSYPLAAFKLVRFPNLLILAFTQFFVAVFLIGPERDWLHLISDPDLLTLVLSTVLIAAGGYVINDYYDIKIDMINKPSRLIVGRFLPRRHAMFVHLILSFSGVFLSVLIHIKIGVIHLFAAFLLWWYSNYLKRLPFVGNLAISVLTGLSVFVVALLYDKNQMLVLFYALFAFFISLIREIIKDMEDVKGDKTFGCLTLPIKYGLRITRKIIFIIEALFLFLLFSIGIFGGIDLLVFYLILVIIPLLLFNFLLYSADTKKDFSFLSKLCKLIMIGGIVSMIFI